MPKHLEDGRTYAGRRPDRAVLNFTLDKDAAVLLRQYAAPDGKNIGRFLSRIIFEYHARAEERARLQRVVAQALVGPVGADDGEKPGGREV